MKESPLYFLASKAKLAICIIAACLDLPVYMVLVSNGTFKAFAAFNISFSISIKINESKANNLHYCILSRPARLHGARLKAFAAFGPFCPRSFSIRGYCTQLFRTPLSHQLHIGGITQNYGFMDPSVP